MNLNTHTPSILTVNAGSSSLRLGSFIWSKDTDSEARVCLSPAPKCEAQVLRNYLHEHSLPTPELIMHRIVHGGEDLYKPRILDDDVVRQIEQIQSLAPLHNAVALQWIRTARAAFPSSVVHAACFDTGYYTDLPAVSRTYPLPKELCQRYGLRRYGFHGLAHQSLLTQWRKHRTSDNHHRVITMQLGGGCSVTATDHGWPIETSMGFSPLGGVMMGTRSGDLDPAVVLHLIEKGKYSAAQLSAILHEQSGLRAVSGESGDFETLMRSKTPAATLAIAMFCHQLRAYVGAYLAVLGGAHAIVFGGGIGEHAPSIRAQVLAQLDWAGVRISHERNHSSNAGPKPIHADDSAVDVWVIPTDEERVMADHARTLPGDQRTTSSDLSRTTP